MIGWIKDNCQWYRRMLGGWWAHYNGQWERAERTIGISMPYICFPRQTDQCVKWWDNKITKREYYLK